MCLLLKKNLNIISDRLVLILKTYLTLFGLCNIINIRVMLTLDEIASNKTEWEKFIKELNEYMKRNGYISIQEFYKTYYSL